MSNDAFIEKTARNFRVQMRYDELMQEGKHGHYETMFRVVHEEVAAERERCAEVCEEEMAPWSSSSRAALAVGVLTECAAAIRKTPQASA